MSKVQTLTCVPGIHNELAHLKGVSLHQTLTVHLHLAGVSNLRLTHHDLEWTICDVFPTLLHAHHMLAHFLWGE